MLDFNAKKDILKRLRRKGSENIFMRVLCAVAAAFVKLWYGVVCGIGMALSDKNGNFLGIKRPERQSKPRKVRRQDDIVYVKKPFWGRVMSAVLAAAFMAMFVPELGLSFDVAAAMGPIQLEYKGVLEDFWRDSTGSNLVVHDNDYKAAYGYQGVQIGDAKKAYGNIKLSWELDSKQYTDLFGTTYELTQFVSGYNIIINTQDGTNLYDRSINNTNTSIKDFEVKLGDYTNDLNIKINPIFRVPAWVYLEGVDDPDNPGEKTSTLTPSGGTTFAPVTSLSGGTKILGKADTHFDASEMNVMLTDASSGTPTEEFYPDSINDVNITWTQPQMVRDGVAVQGEYPDGYIVYLYDYTTNKMSAKKQEIAPSAQGSPQISRSVRTLFSNDLSYGHHYRIFVEAYKNVWGGSPSSYSVNNTGLVTSSLYAVSMGDDNIYKLYQSYPDDNRNLCLDMYVAPYIEFNKIDYTKSSITVSWKKDTGSTYSGVEIYRSTEDIQVNDLVNVLVTNAGKPNNEYGVEKIGEYLEDKTLSHTDYNINKDTRYYYYIVPFITKTRNDTNRIRGTAARNGGSLEFNLTTVRITYTTDNGEVKLKWTQSKTQNNSYGNADGYKLEIFQKRRYNPSTKLFETIAISEDSKPIFSDDTFGPNDLSYTHDGLFNNEVYTYVVTPYVNVNPQSGPPKPYYGPSTSVDVTVGGLLGIPENVTAECTADGEVTIKWDKVPNATGYTIEYTDEYNGEVVKGTLDSKTNTKVHKGLLLNHVITYYVTAYKNVTVQYESQTIYGDKSVPAKVKVGSTLARPQNLKATTTDGTVNISWSDVKGAKGYLLQYKYVKKDGTRVEFVDDITQIKDNVFDLTDKKYTHSGLRNGDRYTYRVLAYKDVSGETVYSPWSDEAWVIVGVPLDAPKDFSGTTKDGRVDLKWTAVKGAEGYILTYRKNGGAWEEFDVSKTSFQHVGLNNGDRYEYYVRAYKTVNGERIFSDAAMSNHLYFTIGDELDSPKDFNVVAADGQANLSWTAVKGAEGYIVYAYGAGSSYQFNVSKTSYIHSGLFNGDTWTYYVAAYKTVNGERVYSNPSESKTVTIGASIAAPRDFTVTTSDGKADLKWTAVKGAEGYIVYASSSGRAYQFDVSKASYSHTGLENGTTWSYRVAAYKTVNGVRIYSMPTDTKTVSIGISLNSAVDLIATAGNRQIDLSWTAVKGAEGYVVYLYNSSSMEFEPITDTSKTKYSHIGLKNGRQYTYMVAPYKTINGKRYYGEYSMAVTAIPTVGSTTDMDHTLNVKGTAPYGISHGEYISAVSNHGAFDESVDVYFTTNRESTQAVKDVLKNYAKGLSSFIVYPFDISVYKEGTRIKVDPADGFFVTVTMPVPDRLIAYRDYITVIHIGDGDGGNGTNDLLASDWVRSNDQRLEVLPCAIVDIDNVWCVQFKCSSFSPYALVIYKEHITDISTGGGILDGGFAGTFNSGVLLFTALPDIMPNNRKLKVVRVSSKRYRIKSIEKR